MGRTRPWGVRHRDGSVLRGSSSGGARPDGGHLLWGGRLIPEGGEHSLGAGTSWGRALCGPSPSWAPSPGAPSGDAAAPRAAAGLCVTAGPRATSGQPWGQERCGAPTFSHYCCFCCSAVRGRWVRPRGAPSSSGVEGSARPPSPPELRSCSLQTSPAHGSQNERALGSLGLTPGPENHRGNRSLSILE